MLQQCLEEQLTRMLKERDNEDARYFQRNQRFHVNTWRGIHYNKYVETLLRGNHHALSRSTDKEKRRKRRRRRGFDLRHGSGSFVQLEQFAVRGGRPHSSIYTHAHRCTMSIFMIQSHRDPPLPKVTANKGAENGRNTPIRLRA